MTLVVGGGIAGVACASALTAAGQPVELRERDHRLGGRMASPRLAGTGTAHDGRVVDVGASYLTARDPIFVEVVGHLVARGVLREWTDAFHVADADGIVGVSAGPMRYAAPRGLADVVRVLADDVPGLTLRLDAPIQRVDVDGRRVRADGTVVDAVALCCPEPHARTVLPALPPAPGVWEPHVCVTMLFDRRTWPDLDGVFVNDDAAVTWIADDGRRRGDDAPVLVAFAHPVLSARHLAEPVAVLPAVVATVRRILGIDATPDWVDAVAWPHAKPLASRAEPCWLHPTAAVGLAGDAWADGPRIEAAWLSGRALGTALADRIATGGR